MLVQDLIARLQAVAKKHGDDTRVLFRMKDRAGAVDPQSLDCGGTALVQYGGPGEHKELTLLLEPAGPAETDGNG